MQKYKKIPYGIASFEGLKENDNYYFVDKTRYIEEIENLGGKYLFFLRPRRFGKSLFLSMLEHYYDINTQDQFDELFGDTYIGKNPTGLRNSFPVLKLNFSGIPTNKGVEEIERSFDVKIRDNLYSFYQKYNHIYSFNKSFEEEFKNSTSAGDLMNHFIEVMQNLTIRYYLLIDEFDNFANNILIHHGKDHYIEVTHKAGFLRSFFASIKVATESRTIERMFATGVSPLVLSDVTSGMNIGDNISFDIIFNSMIGFTQVEVESMLDYYIDEKVVKKDERAEILTIFKNNYNNYSFSDNVTEKIYNTDMILYFFNKYIKSDKIPNNLIDENVRIDYGKLKFLILADREINGNFSLLSKIVDKSEISINLYHSFALNEILDKDKFVSFLYYLGLLTIKKYNFDIDYTLTIPNEVINTMVVDYIRQGLKDGYDLNINVDFLRQEFKKLAFQGEWHNLLSYILDKFYEATSVRDFVLREHRIKMFLLAYLNITPLYYIHSENEMNKGYADLFMQKNYSTTDMTQYEYLIELKYIKAADYRKLTAEEEKSQKLYEGVLRELIIEDVPKSHLQKVRIEAIEQLHQYAKGKQISCKLKKILIICSAQELLVLEEIND